jgi:hypothetical protein
VADAPTSHYIAVPNYVVLEWHGMSIPFWNGIVTGLDGSVIQNGYVEVAESTGWT